MRHFLSTAMLILMPLGAQAVVYDCAVQPGTLNGGWLTEQYFVEYLEESDSVMVYDGLIDHFNNGEPVAGKLTGKNDAKMTFSWFVFIKDNVGQRTKLDFRGVLYFANNELSVQAKPVGYDNKFNARGVCKLAE